MPMVQFEHIPYVSVVVPAYNASALVPTCMEGLLGQTYPRDRYEIIVVDNGSTDDTRQAIQSYPVRLLVEDQLQGAGAARNKGIQRAEGEIIAMIDIKCTPTPGWIEGGVRTLQEEAADLVGGKISFTLSPRRTVAEMYDSISNAAQAYPIGERGYAKTGSLFAHKRVFEEIGLFPPEQRYGEDVIWTHRATRAGFKLVYGPEAEVFYPARRLLPLLRKAYLVGRTQPMAWIDRGMDRKQATRKAVKTTIRSLYRPPSSDTVRSKIHTRGTEDMESHLFALRLVGWLVTIARHFGRMRCVLDWTVLPRQ